MRRNVRILLVGEPGVGKTSLILSLVSEEFPEDVPARAEEITIPADVTPEKVPTHIVDYSLQEQNEQQLIDEIIKANVICIVYSVDNRNTIERITSYWLPLIHRTEPEDQRKPIILVGNKSDLHEASSMEIIMPIMNTYAEIETCVECSAKSLKNISEVFYYAQKAILHPTAPLYVPEEKELTPKCKNALTRIFKICDQDNDGLLNDREIYQFQRRCFNVPLQPQALEDVKAVVRRQIPDGVQRDGITLRGFIYLHTLFIQRGRHETTWTVLRKFGYDDSVELSRDFLVPKLTVPLGCTTELTHQGYQFFSDLFDKYDEDHDGCLSPTELTNLFSTCPVHPWGSEGYTAVGTNAHGWLTHNGYLAQWTLTTLTDVNRTLEYLAYLGYMYEHDNQLSAIHVTRDRRIDLEKRQTNRNVFQCHVIGPKGVGKTVFMQGLLGRNLQYLKTLSSNKFSSYTINLVPVHGQEKYLVLREVELSLTEHPSSSELSCDVFCLLYDVTNPRSFEFCARVYKQYLQHLSQLVLVVGCKAEHHIVLQDHEMQPAEFCLHYNLPPPQLITCLDRINRDVYVRLETMAVLPHLRSLFPTKSSSWLRAGIGLAIIAGLGFLLLRYMRRPS